MASIYWNNTTILCLMVFGILWKYASSVADNTSDLQLCRVTHLGTEYQGYVFRTIEGLRCQFWSSPSTELPRPVEVADEDMPEGSLRAARNFCRNPRGTAESPWCYTGNADVLYDECDVPICQFKGCRLTGPGVEYAGVISRAAHGGSCVSWGKVHDAEGQLYSHLTFPGGSRAGVRSFCRNPDGHTAGPWCLAEHPDGGKRRALCDVPFCEARECTVVTVASTADSHEGPVHAHFMAVRRVARAVEVLTEMPPVAARTGDMGSSEAAATANPSVGAVYSALLRQFGPRLRRHQLMEEGLWRGVRNESDGVADTTNATEEEEAEVVGIPPPVEVADEGSQWRMELGVRLWDAGAWAGAEARVLLSSYAAPSGSGREHAAWGGAVEIRLSNAQSHVSEGVEQDLRDAKAQRWAATPGLLSGLRWTRLLLTMDNEGVAVSRLGDPKPLLQAALPPNVQSAMEQDGGRPRFLSVWGPGIMWDLRRCARECTVHWTSRLLFVRFHPMREAAAGARVAFSLRAQRSAFVELRAAPTQTHPNLWVALGERHEVLISVQEEPHEPRDVLVRLTAPALLDFWEWRSFTLSVFADEVQVHWVRGGGAELVASGRHDVARHMRWFSVASDDSLAKWTFFCEPSASDAVPAALPPDCATTRAERGFSGEHAIASSGRPCLPWTAAPLPRALAEATLPGVERVRARSDCRNLDGGRLGPFCFTLPEHLEKKEGGDEEVTAAKERGMRKVSRELCSIRSCQSTDCRVAGTANDYDGPANMTRTGRKCLFWTHVKNTLKVPPQHVNESFFPDESLERAENFCRNPSRSVGGTWCYTDDPHMPVDLCSVRDCEKNDECTVLLVGSNAGQRIYLLPEWRKKGFEFAVKRWDPDKEDGVVVTLAEHDSAGYLKLVLGAGDNERVELYLSKSGSVEEELKRKTLPKMVPAGRWGEYWIRLPPGGVELGLKGMPNALFDWVTEPPQQFSPTFATFSSLLGDGGVGVAFPCRECHIVETKDRRMSILQPIGLWYKYAGYLWDNMTIHMRGNGTANVILLKMPESQPFYVLKFDKNNKALVFQKKINDELHDIKRIDLPYSPISDTRWTKVFIKWREHRLGVKVDKLSVKDLSVPDEALLFYFFSVVTDGVPVSWTVNCQPLEISEEPVHGGWSEWSAPRCSVTCGGGRGLRTRKCDNPPPNIFGRTCVGPDSLEVHCNNFVCGHVSPEVLNVLRFNLRTEGHSRQTTEGEEESLRCDEHALQHARVQAPNTTVEWLHNGQRLPYSSAPNRVRVSEASVDISHAHPSDNGVYLCILRGAGVERRGGDEDLVVVRALSLAVFARRPTHRPRIVKPWPQLRCRGSTLGMVFAQLSVVWRRNGIVFKDYGVTTPAAVEFLDLENVTEEFSGNWTCEIEEDDLQFIWITNWIWLEVRPAPTILTHLMEDDFTAPLFGWMKSEKIVAGSLIFIIILTIGLVAAGVYVYLRYIMIT